MIRGVPKKINQETTLVTSERARQESSLRAGKENQNTLPGKHGSPGPQWETQPWHIKAAMSGVRAGGHVCSQLPARPWARAEARDQLDHREGITDEKWLTLGKLSSVLESPSREIPEIHLAGSPEELCTEIPYTYLHGPVYFVCSTDSLNLRVHMLFIRWMFGHDHSEIILQTRLNTDYSGVCRQPKPDVW